MKSYIITAIASFAAGALAYRYYYGKVSATLRKERDELLAKLKAKL